MRNDALIDFVFMANLLAPPDLDHRPPSPGFIAKVNTPPNVRWAGGEEALNAFIDAAWIIVELRGKHHDAEALVKLYRGLRASAPHRHWLPALPEFQ